MQLSLPASRAARERATYAQRRAAPAAVPVPCQEGRGQTRKARRCGVYEGQSGAPWWVRLDAVTTERYQVAIQSGYVNTTLPAIVIGPRLAGYGGARCREAGPGPT
jgi:hypothetical protein